MKMNNNIDFLQQVAIFSQLSRDEVQAITGFFQLLEAGQGHVLFREGDDGEELFIVKSGCVVSSILLPDGNDREIARFGSGDFFGEMSIIERAPRSATCSAKNDSVLLSLHENDFYKIMNSFPDVAIKIMYKMLNIITQRLQNTSGFLSDMVHWGEEASRRAITDELTGVYNRRYLDEALQQHFETSKNTGKPLSLIMVDLDYFREINENYGHAAGDNVILNVVDVFKHFLRKKDIIARYGGDEFTVLLPGTDLAETHQVAETIRCEVEKLNVLTSMNGPVKCVTTSQGIASFPENASDLKTLKEMADKALYRAKEEGRNRVIRASSAAS